MKKKVITLLMAAAIMSAALSGCGDTAVEEPTPVAEDKEPSRRKKRQRPRLKKRK